MTNFGYYRKSEKPFQSSGFRFQLIDLRSVGDHWEPYWHNCQVCDPSLKPNYILKLETLKEDLKIYLRKIGLYKYVEKFPWVNSQKGRHSGTLNTSLRVIEFYSKLDRSTILQLYEFYR